MEHYGLPPAPYANGGYPMGLREASSVFGKGLTNDCLLFHAGSIACKSYVGLGNVSLDFQAFWEDLIAGSGRPPRTPFVFINFRVPSAPDSMALFLLYFL